MAPVPVDRGPGEHELVERVRAALRHDAGLDAQALGIDLAYEDGVLTMRGELPNLAMKKRALAAAAALPGVRWIADRLRVQPSMPMGDDAIRDHVCDAWVAEPTLSECAIDVREEKGRRTVQDPEVRRGFVELEVNQGVVILSGCVPSLSHKRLAAVLCWWVPGTRDVVNDLVVDPPEEDSDAEIADAVRLVLEKDPLIDVVGIGVTCDAGVVTLRGCALSSEQRSLAEADAWYTFGVVDVIDELELASQTGPT